MNQFAFSLFAFVIFCSGPLVAEKVLIITHSYNRPDFIEIQHKTFKKFLKDEYEFVVFNDATDENLREQINLTCSNLGLRCLSIPQEIHHLPYLPRLPQDWWNHPSIRCSNVVQYSLNKLGFFHDGIVAIFDSDLFLVKDFSITEFLNNYHLAGLLQSRSGEDGAIVEYLWVGLAFLDMTKMPNKLTINFNTGRINNVSVDPGGYTYFYLNAHPDINVRNFDQFVFPCLCNNCEKAGSSFCIHNADVLRAHGLDQNQIELAQSGALNSEFFEKGTFLHYRGGTNWDFQSEEYHRRKTEFFDQYFKRILD